MDSKTTEVLPQKRAKIAGKHTFKVKFGTEERLVEFPPEDHTTGDLRRHIEDILGLHNAKITKLVKGKAVQSGRESDQILLSTLKIKRKHKIVVVGARREDFEATAQALFNSELALKAQKNLQLETMRDKRQEPVRMGPSHESSPFAKLETFEEYFDPNFQKAEEFVRKFQILETLSGQLWSTGMSMSQTLLDRFSVDYARVALEMLKLSRCVKDFAGVVPRQVSEAATSLMRRDIIENHDKFPKMVSTIFKAITNDTVARTFELEGHHNLFERNYGVLTIILGYWSRIHVESQTGAFFHRDVCDQIFEFVGDPAGFYFASLYDSFDYDDEGNVTKTYTLEVNLDGTYRYYTQFQGAQPFLESSGVLTTRWATYSVSTSNADQSESHLGMIDENESENVVSFQKTGFTFGDVLSEQLCGFQPYPFYKKRIADLMNAHEPQAADTLDDLMVACLFERNDVFCWVPQDAFDANGDMDDSDVEIDDAIVALNLEARLWEKYRQACKKYRCRALPRFTEYARRIVTFRSYLDEVYCEIEGCDRQFECARYAQSKH